jgi:glycosyltransferase involved in cell wall biosynthesis
MKKITFVIPSRNNLEFLQLAYKSIRNLKTQHEILVLNDASTDGTQEWIESVDDPDLIVYHNKGPKRIGIVGMFDKGIEMARSKIIMAYHADMVAAPDLDKHILKHLEKGTVVSATRVEPPLHPDGPEKVLEDFGSEVEEFELNEFYNWVRDEYKPKHGKSTTEGIFAPWCMYKEDFLKIGGHDRLFSPQSKEDSDLFNRFVLNGYNIVQTWEGLVYHFTSRGSRFNKHAGGNTGKNSPEWIATNSRNSRNFIRKWGHFVKHDDLMKPIIPSKYNVAFRIHNCTLPLLEALEPWCDIFYGDGEWFVYEQYIQKEQPNTQFILKDKIKPLEYELYDDFEGVVVIIDGSKFTQQDFQLIQQLSEILDDSGETGEFEMGNLKINIGDLTTHENKLIICE